MTVLKIRINLDFTTFVNWFSFIWGAMWNFVSWILVFVLCCVAKLVNGYRCVIDWFANVSPQFYETVFGMASFIAFMLFVALKNKRSDKLRTFKLYIKDCEKANDTIEHLTSELGKCAENNTELVSYFEDVEEELEHCISQNCQLNTTIGYEDSLENEQFRTRVAKAIQDKLSQYKRENLRWYHHFTFNHYWKMMGELHLSWETASNHLEEEFVKEIVKGCPDYFELITYSDKWWRDVGGYNSKTAMYNLSLKKVLPKHLPCKVIDHTP